MQFLTTRQRVHWGGVITDLAGSLLTEREVISLRPQSPWSLHIGMTKAYFTDKANARQQLDMVKFLQMQKQSRLN